ncbi:Protein BATH-24 [Aphelenchoides avenae]|nr:Protein BATH-24 [Aphelenchus avenae]
MTQIGQRTKSPRQQVVDNATYLVCRLVAENEWKWSAAADATFLIVKKNGNGFGNEKSFRKRLMGKEPLAGSLGWTKFVTSEELLSAANGFVIDDSVEIRVDFSVTDACGASFNVFETAGAFAADIKLKVGEGIFYANKGYLSVVSSVFPDMFALTETAEGQKETEEIVLKDLDASDFKDANVVSVFRIADRFDVQRVVADCERHLLGANSVPWFDKLKLAVDLSRDQLKDRLISKMTCGDIKAINQHEKKGQLGVEVLQALLDKHIRKYQP